MWRPSARHSCGGLRYRITTPSAPAPITCATSAMSRSTERALFRHRCQVWRRNEPSARVSTNWPSGSVRKQTASSRRNGRRRYWSGSGRLSMRTVLAQRGTIVLAGPWPETRMRPSVMRSSNGALDHRGTSIDAVIEPALSRIGQNATSAREPDAGKCRRNGRRTPFDQCVLMTCLRKGPGLSRSNNPTVAGSMPRRSPAV